MFYSPIVRACSNVKFDYPNEICVGTFMGEVAASRKSENLQNMPDLELTKLFIDRIGNHHRNHLEKPGYQYLRADKFILPTSPKLVLKENSSTITPFDRNNYSSNNNSMPQTYQSNYKDSFIVGNFRSGSAADHSKPNPSLRLLPHMDNYNSSNSCGNVENSCENVESCYEEINNSKNCVVITSEELYQDLMNSSIDAVAGLLVFDEVYDAETTAKCDIISAKFGKKAKKESEAEIRKFRFDRTLALNALILNLPITPESSQEYNKK